MTFSTKSIPETLTSQTVLSLKKLHPVKTGLYLGQETNFSGFILSAAEAADVDQTRAEPMREVAAAAVTLPMGNLQ